MITLIVILTISLLIVFLCVRTISQRRTAELNTLQKQRNDLQHRYEFMVGQRKSLRAEVKEKERQITTLRNNQHGLKTISASDLDNEEVDDNEKVSRYLIQEGKITLEQNEKVLKKMETLQMDYLGVCLTLGYVDIETAKKAIKINRITTKSAELN